VAEGQSRIAGLRRGVPGPGAGSTGRQGHRRLRQLPSTSRLSESYAHRELSDGQLFYDCGHPVAEINARMGGWLADFLVREALAG